MNSERLATGIGVGATALMLFLTVVPYAVAGETAITAYYRAGFASPIFISLLAVIGAITLVSATSRRSDPALAAGIAVTVSGFAVVLSLLWAVPASDVALGFDLSTASILGVDAATVFTYHPHAVVLVALLLAGAAGMYARAVL